MRLSSRSIKAVVLAGVLSACARSRPEKQETGGLQNGKNTAPSASLNGKKLEEMPARAMENPHPLDSSNSWVPYDESSASVASSNITAARLAFVDKKPIDIATGSLVALASVGALIRRNDDDVMVVQFGDKNLPLVADGSAFAKSPTLAIDHSASSFLYWVREGKLLRREVDKQGKCSPVETLATDAQDGTIPRGVRTEGELSAACHDVVAYVARRRTRDGDRRARIWIERKGTWDLSPEGSGASSVSVISDGPQRVVALSLDSRSALAPVHAMTIEITREGAPKLGADSLVWIAPASELFAHLFSARVASTLFALLPTTKNGLEFGLATVPVHMGSPPVDTPMWYVYPNGLDPAPLATVRFCGQASVILVRPLDRPVGSAKVIELATLNAQGAVFPQVEVGRAAQVDHMTAWSSAEGDGWVGWAGDGRTWLRQVRCKP